MCECTPPMTFVKHLGNDSKSTHQISTQSSQPLQRNSRRNICDALQAARATCHSRQWALTWFSIGPIHGRRDGATHQRRPLVNRAYSSRGITYTLLIPYKHLKSVTTAGRPVAHTQDFPLFSVELARPSASLVTRGFTFSCYFHCKQSP